jgi:transcriptional regulator with XRE-family HTH domain
MTKKLNVKKIREAHGLTVQQLADMAGVNHSTAWRWESGAVEIRGMAYAFLSKLAKQAGLTK